MPEPENSLVKISIGDFDFQGPTERNKDVFGQSPDKIQTTGTANLYLVSGPENIEVILQDTKWKDGTRSITARETQGNAAIERLERGLALGIRSHGSLQFFELRQARITDVGAAKPWSQCFKADMTQLNRGAGMNVSKALEEHGAAGIGTKEDLLGETNRRKKMLCVTFPESAHIVPCLAYLLSRVIPLATGFSDIDA